ncbi:glycine--tRNA ligase [Micromonospora sp. NPDC049559]|uniref:glycine--tRNA ligase n=1 Tax=Micromonospora sp. NPDC049559 TaxID=3155923 RepID=UPI0034288208
MQDALARLAAYWNEQGCLTVQPMNTEVGAGTLNPATALRVLGPEPWRVAYVEPSVRPDDARYGENPNRIQTHTQFQVILKPEPGNPQELYLGSLTALGIDVAAHDVRFVEDNWASPALGAWGLGWEVWLDGLEITQFTYFQQAGGLNLDPPAVEITYGIERILMALQGVRHFKEIEYAPGVSYGEIFGQAEYEMSRYYLDDADVETTRTLLDSYAAEAQRMVDAGLPVPAHNHVLKMSHAFNVLDSRGAVSTAERAAEFARMRRLSGAVARLWVNTREAAGYPLGVAAPTAAPAETPTPRPADGPRTLVFEIGVEEMPPAEARATREQVESALTSRLAAGRLAHGTVTVRATPRRVVATVTDVAPVEADQTRTVRGPKVSAAYRADGSPTPAAAGFARANKVEVGALERVTLDGVEHLAVRRHEPGRPAAEALAPVLGEIVTGLRSARNMRWNDPSLSFTRPIRWLLALLGDQVVPVRAGALVAGRTTRLHRASATPVVEVPDAEAYPEVLAAAGVRTDQDARRTAIAEAAVELAAGVSGRVDLDAEAALLDQVVFLVEQPTAILGSFEPDYLDLPEPVLTTVMRKHQRYLPVRGADGRLLPYFVAVANGDVDVATVRAGNEAVLRARFEDAAFFHRADLNTTPAELRGRLTRLTFTDRLGSMSDRAERIAALARSLAAELPLSEQDRNALDRAAALVKFDLGAQMVIELTSLAGTMAREYALAAGEPPAVAQALLDTELPRSAGDALPATVAGALLSVADRLDSLVGLAATVGLPTGSSDPFALRRAALGILAVIRANPVLGRLSLASAIARAAAGQPVEVDAATREAVGAFLARRFEQQLTDEGQPVDRVRAVLTHADQPRLVDQLLAQLAHLVGRDDFTAIATALQRARRIVPAGTTAEYDPDRLVEPAERRLHEAVKAVRGGLDGRIDLDWFIATAGELGEPVQRFFDEVLVMAEVPEVRAARLGLLAAVRDLGDRQLDWDALRL